MTVTKRNGTAVSQPGEDTYRVTSDWVTPMTRPAAVVIGKEENLPMTAAASTGTMIKESVVILRLVMGTSSMAANPPRAAPTPQLTVAMRLGEMARVAAAVGFSATAVVARPKGVKR